MEWQNQPGFTLKQFHVAHHLCAMKVGTDGMLLGAWAQINKEQHILDVGCGSGLISLMLAQRSAPEIKITALDIDPDACEQTRLNVMHSPWPNRIGVVEADFLNFVAPPFTHIVCNPPYFAHGQSFNDHRRAIARQTGALLHSQLLDKAAILLKERGRVSLVLPFAQAQALIDYAVHRDWFVHRLCEVKSKPTQAEPVRLLVELARFFKETEHQQLVIEDAPGRYSSGYRQLCQDFYLNM
ncbi:tRNA1(Val) (adenine(37)-N6)-methyltransferase [Celerinatantimonas diazotrophica]|uniref:tRNA1(Val) (adenine(37)-N6)-methyltransferase n=1 Tax=Celerinatantimonas diazotrophica TaxID=412034 RepID=A0A4R1JLX6_9GAMM|nr:methyltransferase [Celerinatantimonas diazotrophica]TCK52075.1 tRNA1Val (adenine37-N6)-methyltransferase [Celerinatantimonas diazotrophica]CAG9296222.1 tRNA1(Val) (adenine(37)-N6)-methyltransferase [Celerinatantimonas diazotrophica]